MKLKNVHYLLDIMKMMLTILSNLSEEKNEYESYNRHECPDFQCLFWRISKNNDLLIIEQFGNVQIVTAKEFYEKCLLD